MIPHTDVTGELVSEGLLLTFVVAYLALIVGVYLGFLVLIYQTSGRDAALEWLPGSLGEKKE